MQINKWDSTSNAENIKKEWNKMLQYLHIIPTQKPSWQRVQFVVHMDIKDFRLPDKLALDPEASQHKF